MNIMPTNNFNNKAYSPNFKGAKEIEAAKKIISRYSETSAIVGAAMMSLPASKNPILTGFCVDMIAQISDLYKIDTGKQAAIKFVTDQLSTNKEKESSIVLRIVANMSSLGNFADFLWARKFITTTGEKFVQHCEIIQKQH